ITYIRSEGLSNIQVDLVTAFVSLHHIADIGKTLREISSMLSPNGAFIIREHDYNGTKVMRDFLDLIHVFIDLRDHNMCNLDEITAADYKSQSSWDSII